jgi:transcriptional regulator with XRE-family HTH domain
VRVRSPAELGALIRPRRRQLGLEQSALAGKVGVSRQCRRDWIKTADQLRVESDSVIARIHHMAAAIPDRATQIGTETRDAGIADPIIDRLVTRLVGRARLCLKLTE